MKHRLRLNNFLTLVYQVISILVGLFLPRLFLSAYGSNVNGLVSSITQMLSIITLLDFGVGAVVQSSLYKPLSQNDYESISNIYSSAKKYFKVIAEILLIYIFLLFLYFGFVKNTGYTPIYTITLIISISISSFAQYYFGICNSLLLNADQKIYITSLVSLFTMILNAILTLVLINAGMSVQIVKLISSLIFMLKPIIYSIYVKKYYKIKLVNNPPKDALKQKWHGLAQHVSSVVTNSTDYIVLTIFSSLETISIYNIYVMPLNSVKALMESMSSSYKSYFGKLYAENRMSELKIEFRKYEIAVHFLTVIIFCCICKVIVPFVLLYTSGVKDVNYENYLFSYFITLAYAIYALRIPYTTVIFSAGHFKQTQLYCIIETILNISISFICVIKFGLVGVAFGTCIGVGYRLIASAYYLEKSIIYRKLSTFVKTIIIDFISVGFILICTSFFTITSISVLNWIVYSMVIFIICLTIAALIFSLGYPSFVKKILKRESKKIIE